MTKRKRGRPRIHPLKHIVAAAVVPKKVAKKPVKKEVINLHPPTNVYQSKFLGYCPKCDVMVSSRDMISKFIYECSCCNHRARLKTLLAGKKNAIEKPESQKRYLKETNVNVNKSDIIPVDYTIDVTKFKVIT